jgi:hypothetical protein
VNIYLGTTMAMVEGRGVPKQVIEFPPTWPTEQVLESVAQCWKAMGMADGSKGGKTQKRRTLHLTLSGARCRADAFPVPQGVRKFQELQAYFAGMQTDAAGVNGGRGPSADSTHVVTEFDPRNPGLVASMDSVLLSQLNAWAKEENASIQTLRPLWSVATQCGLARVTDKRALVLTEPDGVTLLADSTDAMHLSLDASLESGLMPIAQWKIAHDLADREVLSLEFGRAHPTLYKGAPEVWVSHWNVL